MARTLADRLRAPRTHELLVFFVLLLLLALTVVVSQSVIRDDARPGPAGEGPAGPAEGAP